MKKIGDQDFATSSLRKRYEDMKRNQFFLGEQSLTKDDQWPDVPTANNHTEGMFRSMPELTPSSPIKDANNSRYKEDGGRRNALGNKSNNSLFTDQMPRDDDMESVTTARGQQRSSLFPNSNQEDKHMSGLDDHASEDENESPSHSHPAASYDNIRYVPEIAPGGSTPMNVNTGAPTPTIIAGAASMGTGVGRGLGSRPVAGLVGYGDSDDSD